MYYISNKDRNFKMKNMKGGDIMKKRGWFILSVITLAFPLFAEELYYDNTRPFWGYSPNGGG
jgi:hypothetical protein